MTFDDIFSNNHVVYHDMSCHDLTPSDSSQGIYVIAWKSVSCTHMEMPFFGKIVNFTSCT